ncbi:MAG TPA: hypothetical protein VHO48_07030 [Anaerolineaceae bacterium]|nr:hypothetical protein [Anaerolineaceae bacterium]
MRYEFWGHRIFQFDNDPKKVGTKVGENTVEDIKQLIDRVHNAGIRVAMVTVPGAAAQEVVDCLVEAGVKAILSYAPMVVHVPPDVRVQYIDPVIHLQRMTYYLE